jgi:subtilisin family serine protease
MKIKVIIISIVLLLVMVFASGCIPVLEKLGLVNPTNEEQLSPEKGGPPDGLVKVLIGFKEKPGAAQQAMVRGVGGKIKYTYNIVDAIAASIPEKAIEALRKNPNVRYVELDGIVYALDEELDNSWGVKHIGAGVVHDSGNKGVGVKIAIIDTGIDYTHSDLELNYKGGFDFVNSVDANEDGDYDDPGDTKDEDPMDDNGHGTHVAGIVAALDDNIGVVGVAPEADLYALKVLDETGSGWMSDVVAAIDWATLNGMQVINMSLGGGELNTLEEACLAAEGEGLLLIASAGNNGNPPGRGDNVGYPAAYSSVIAVAATDQNDKRARWSSTGPAVELAAPGVGIYSTYIGGYATYSGTSMAAPHVAGVAALIIASGTTVASDVRGKLTGTADDLGEAGWDSKYGHGLVDAAEAVGVLNDLPIVSITSPTDGSTFESGVTIYFSGTASDTEDGDLTGDLVWTSDIDGSMDTGGSFSMIMNDGDHTITTNVTDSGGATGSASIGITVGTPSTNIMHVSDIYMSLKIAGINVNAIATVTIVDADGNLEGATVFGQWSGATNDTDSGVTDASGQVSLVSDKVKNLKSGTFTFTVDDVTKYGWTYDTPANVETSDSVIFPEE